jgi:hypothetical protein
MTPCVLKKIGRYAKEMCDKVTSMGMRCLPIFIFIFIFLQRANLIGPSLKRKMKLLRLPKIEGSILKSRVPPLLPTYIGERRTTFSQAHGTKVRCYGEHAGERIGNLM